MLAIFKVGRSSSRELSPEITHVRIGEYSARISTTINFVNNLLPHAELGKLAPKFPMLPTPVSASKPNPPQKNYSYCVDSHRSPLLPDRYSSPDQYRRAAAHIKKLPPKITAIEAT